MSDDRSPRERAKQVYRQMLLDGPGEGVDRLRARFDDRLIELGGVDGATTTDLTVDGVPAIEVRAPGVGTDRGLVWFHGGGYTIGSARGYGGIAGALSRACDATVVVVDYRLAPEHRFPAAVDDATAAVRWAVERFGPSATCVGGDSAGGGLTFAAVTRLRDAGEPLPAALVAVSPLVDLTGSGASYETNREHDDVLSLDSLRVIRRVYLRDGDPRNPEASPLYAELHELPPTLVLASTTEALRDDAEQLAQRLGDHGSEVRLEMYPEMVHAWPLFWPIVPEAAQAVDQVGEFVRLHAVAAS